MTTPFNADSLPSLASLVREYGLTADKKFGQHFLLDIAVCRKIVQHALIQAGSHIFEVGPGPGGLTRALLESPAATVLACEIDERAITLLQPLQQAADGRLQLVRGDALTLDMRQLLPAPRHIIANLPYNIGTALVTNWLTQQAQDPTSFVDIVVMLQKEVADRIVARPNTKAYGRLSIFCQWLCDCRILFTVPAGAFSPPPQVVSAIIRLQPRATRLPAPLDALEQVTAAAFNNRRKMLRQSLKSLVVPAATLLSEADLDGTKRAEDLTVADFCKLADCYARLKPIA